MAIKIPFYDSQAGMSPEAAGARMPQPAAAPMESVEAAGLPGLRVARAGDQLLTAATAINERLTHARAINDFADMNLKMHLGLNQVANELQQDVGAPETWAKRFEEGAAKVRQEVSGLTQNPLAQTSFDKTWSSVYPAKLQELTAKGRVQDSKNFAGGFEEKYPQFAELYAQAADDLSRAQIKGTVDNYILQAVASGFLSPEKGAEARLKFIPEAMKFKVLGDIRVNPAGVLERLNEPEKYYPGLAPGSIYTLSGTANQEMHRRQEENYSHYMQNILGATADNPVQGAVMPTEEDILPQIGKTLKVSGAENILAFVRGQKASQGTGQENKTPISVFKEIAVRMTNPDHPLTRDEYLKNTTSEGGKPPVWPVSGHDYFANLKEIESRGIKLPKLEDSAFKAELAFQKTQFTDQFGIGKEYYQTAVGQAWAAKNDGTLGKTPEEVKTKLKEIFDLQMRPYRAEIGLNKPKTPKTGTLDKLRNWWGEGESAPAPAGTIRNDKSWMSNDLRGSK